MKPGLQKGTRLTRRDKRAIRREVKTLAKQTGSYAYTFRYDGDEVVEFRADAPRARVRGWLSGLGT